MATTHTVISVPHATRAIIGRIYSIRRWPLYVTVDEAVKDYARRHGVAFEDSSMNEVSGVTPSTAETEAKSNPTTAP